MKKYITVILTLCILLALFSGCTKPTQLQIDYADFVQLSGISYINADAEVPADKIGEKLGAVKRNPPTAVTAEEPPSTLDGDAAQLKVGTQIYSIEGFDSKNYVAAEQGGKFLLYSTVGSEEISFSAEESELTTDYTTVTTTKPALSTQAPETTASVENEAVTITLKIEEIYPDYFTAMLPWPSPLTYKVIAKIDSNYCAGDTVEVAYSGGGMQQKAEFEYEITALSVSPSSFETQPGAAYKPIIYLYPTKETEVSVSLDYRGTLTHTYPVYNSGWRVIAMPNGTLRDNGGEYPYLFWEGESDTKYDMSRGYCVKGSESEKFLCGKLAYMGLNEKETADFLAFWLPKLEENNYNIISFQGKAYTSSAKLNVNPAPDTVIRVFMAYSPIDNAVEIAPQTLPHPARRGFTLVEWGGSLVKM